MLTRKQAFSYFRISNLTYSDIDQWAVRYLITLLDYHFAEYRKDQISKTPCDYIKWYHTVTNSKGVHIKFSDNGGIKYLKLYARTSTLELVEAIAFYENGVIRFGQGLSESEIQPVLQAFIDFCDWLSERKFCISNMANIV